MPEKIQNISLSTEVKDQNITVATSVVTNNVLINGISGFASNSFNSIWKTDNTGTSLDTQITLPTTEAVNYFADWGDGNLEYVEGDGTAKTHTYDTAGTYTVKILTPTGTFSGLQFNDGGDKAKLLDVTQCGCLDISTSGTFWGCSNLTWTATDAPSISTLSLGVLFRQCTNFNGAVGNWDVSSVLSISNTFSFCPSFDQDLSSWDISSVTSAGNFLNGSTLSTANLDALITSWGNQTLQSNVDINLGDGQFTATAAVTAAYTNMLDAGWTITDNGWISDDTDAFTFVVDTTQAGSASDTFVVPVVEDQTNYSFVNWGDGYDIIKTSIDTAWTHQFSSSGSKTVKVNGEMKGWQFNNLGDKAKLSDVTQCGVLDISTTAAFKGCSNLTWTATDAPTISTTTLFDTFSVCLNFNGSVGNWDVGSVISFATMFYFCGQFNQDLSSWDMSSATNISNMLGFCANFDQDLSSWDITSITSATNFYRNTLSTVNYDATLIGWGPQAVNSGVSISFGSSTYTLGGAAEAAKDSLIGKGWTITDGGGV